MTQSFIIFFPHSAPVAYTFFRGYLIRIKDLFWKTFQVRFPFICSWKGVLSLLQAPGHTDHSCFLFHQKTSDYLWNPAFLCVFRSVSCSTGCSMFSFKASSCPCIIRTIVLNSSRLQLFNFSSICLVQFLKLFSICQKTQRIANRQSCSFRHSAPACIVVW